MSKSDGGIFPGKDQGVWVCLSEQKGIDWIGRTDMKGNNNMDDKCLMDKRWKYYNHAIIPTCEPHVVPDVSLLENREWFRSDKWGGKVFFAVWTADFDCGYETGWWYTIKDSPFDITSLKSNRRYKITKGMRNFDVRRIDVADYKKEMFDVTVAAYEDYPENLRLNITKEDFCGSIDSWSGENDHVYAAFHKTEKKMCAYIYLYEGKKDIELHVLKSIPSYEKLQVNAAIIYYALCDMEKKLAGGKYISNGWRNINHATTHFPDYLEKYFGFRKAYVKLHIKYRPGFRVLIKILYPFRKIVSKLDKYRHFHMANSVLKMEEIRRESMRYET